MNHKPWVSIFETHNINDHDFSKSPFYITAKEVKQTTIKAGFSTTNETEARILCKQDSRENRPQVFIDNNLFIVSVKNGTYAIIQGEGYVDIPPITTITTVYKSKLDFELKTSLVGNSEMQHLDFAYASSLIRSYFQDNSLVLTVRGRKFTPNIGFKFQVGNHLLEAKSVQAEVDAGYEGKTQIVLIEAKNSKTKNTIIRQLYYPFRAWQIYTQKKVNILFFEKQKNDYSIWEFGFSDVNNYNSIQLLKSEKFEIKP